MKTMTAGYKISMGFTTEEGSDLEGMALASKIFS